MNTQAILDDMMDMDDFTAERVDLPATQIAFTAENGRELVRWGAPGVTAERLAASLPQGTVWREVSREQGEAIVAFVPLDDAKARKLAEIDRETASAILAGFAYQVDGHTYHFSYDERDQQNFADAANMILLARLEGQESAPVNWNGYAGGEQKTLILAAQSFMALYAAAVAHKSTVLQTGRSRKQAAINAADADALAAV